MAQNSNMLMIGLVLIVIITAGLTYYITMASSPHPFGNETNASGGTPTITVRGEASKTILPDLLTIGISIETFGNDTASSEAQNSKDTAKLKAALLAAGLNSSEIQTSAYYTSPAYEDSCGCAYYGETVPAYQAAANSASLEGKGAYLDIVPEPMPYPYRCKCNSTGYKTIHQLIVKTDKLSDGGRFVESAINSANSTKIDYVYFSIKDETRIKLEGELQASAAAAAKAKGENIAKGLGAKLGKIVSINPDYYYPYPVYAYDKATSSGGSATPAVPPTEIFPTDTTMSASITVVYELVQ